MMLNMYKAGSRRVCRTRIDAVRDLDATREDDTKTASAEGVQDSDGSGAESLVSVLGILCMHSAMWVVVGGFTPGRRTSVLLGAPSAK